MQMQWTYEPFISFEEMLMFRNAMSNHSEPLVYYPVAKAKRSEVGTRYRYLCIVNAIEFPAGPSRFVIIELYKPEQGMPYTTKLLRIPVEE